MKNSKFLNKKIHPYDPNRVQTVAEALTELQECSFQGRNLGRAVETLQEMIQTPNCFKVLTLSGAMIPAGMEICINRGIENGFFDAIVTTGANIIHSIVNCFAPNEQHQYHFIGDSHVDDDKLYQARINRIYDTFLPETGYHQAENELLQLLSHYFPNDSDNPKIIPPSKLFKILGENLPGSSFLTVAADHHVPIFCGATSDSELGLDLMKYRKTGKINIILDELGDIEIFGDYIKNYTKHGTIILGGGVPRNWAQQIFPYLDQMPEFKDHEIYKGYRFSVRFHTAIPYDGGLSGCTISESKSWGKYATHSNHQSVWVDSTIGFPLVITALLQNLQNQRGKP